MTPWKPPVKEPEPLLAGVTDFARMRLPTIFGVELNEPKKLGRDQVCLANGEEAVVELTAMPAVNRQFGQRAAISYTLDGYAATRSIGYRAQGSAIVDVKTQAFLELVFTLEPVGEIRPDGG